MNYNYKEKLFPVSRFFIKLIIVILAIFLIVCICYKTPSKKQEVKKNSNSAKTLSDNLQKMKKEALKYFNEETVLSVTNFDIKIPFKKINKKLIIKDEDNKKCDFDSSYVTLRKISSNSYEMKVFLKCQKDQDYIIVKLKNNGNCSTFLCQENDKKKNLDKEENINTDTNYEINQNTKEKTTEKTGNITKKISKKKRKSNYRGSIEIVDTTNDRYVYQYVNENNVTYSSWSNWVNSGYVSCLTNNTTCSSDKTCLKEEKVERQNNYQVSYINKISIKKVNRTLLNVCRDYNYIVFNNTLYRVNSDYSNISNWQYITTEKYLYPPKDTLNTKYIYIKTSNDQFGNRQLYFDKYVYNDIIYSNSCNTNYIQKSIDSYSYQTDSIKVSQESQTCIKMVRTRTIINTPQYTWSSYNNKYLLNNGYKYTGIRELKNR